MLQYQLHRVGYAVGRKHVGTLMKHMGLRPYIANRVLQETSLPQGPSLPIRGVTIDRFNQAVRVHPDSRKSTGQRTRLPALFLNSR